MLLTTILVAAVGIIVGGIINALADDLPRHRRPRLPHYPDGEVRALSAWLGIVAFVTGKRASSSGARLSWRHPITEVATMFSMLLALVVKQTEPEASDTQLIFWLIYMAIFVLVTVIDIEHKLILFVVMIPSAIIAVLDALITPAQLPPNIGRALLGGALGFGVFFLLYLGGFLYVYITNTVQERNITEVAFGYGDVMLATVSGLILGLEAMIFAMFITVFLGAFGALIYLVGRRLVGRSANMFTALPYGPYIVLGTSIMLFFSDEVRFLLAGY